MLDVKQESYREGTLGRHWEQGLQQSPELAPRIRRRRRRWSQSARTVYWIAGMWTLALVVTLGAVHVVRMAYQVDALEARYTTLIDQQQTLGVKISELTTPYALQQDALKLHVALHAPLASAPSRKLPATRRSPSGFVAKLFREVQGALVGR